MKLESSFSDRLKTIMSIRKVKAIEVSNATGISKANISNYLSGRYEPKQKNIYLLSKYFGVNEMWLIGYDCTMDKFSPTIDELKKKIIGYLDEMNENQLEKTLAFIKEYIL